MVVAGVQEGTWPTLGETGSLFGQEELVDVLDDGIDPNIPISRSVERLAEERRLFRLATSRATGSLFVTAVDAPDAEDALEPSRFLEELCSERGIEAERVEEQEASIAATPGGRHDRRLLSTTAIVAEVRGVVCGPAERARRREQAARQLARLARAGVYGADPEEWWGMRGASTREPLQKPRRSVQLSPSRIESTLRCPLRSVLDRLVDDADTPIHMVRGTLAHGFAEAIARGADSDAASALVYEAYAGLLDVPVWQRDTALREWDTLIDNLERWLENTRGQFEQVGVEMDMRVSVGTTESGAPLRIKGRMDRLERNNDGELVVVDVKTGSSKPAQKNMGEHAQLSAYQLALSRGVVDGDRVRDPYPGETPEAVGGGVLVYPSATDVGKYTTREQAAKTPEELEELAAMLPGVAAAIRGPALTAIVNDNCDNCRLQSICPAQPTGRMLTNGS